jgi:hypothetical protein
VTRLWKPITRKVTTRMTSHGYRPDLVITLHPDGSVEIREAGTRQAPVLLNLAQLYVQARIAAALKTSRRR